MGRAPLTIYTGVACANNVAIIIGGHKLPGNKSVSRVRSSLDNFITNKWLITISFVDRLHNNELLRDGRTRGTRPFSQRSLYRFILCKLFTDTLADKYNTTRVAIFTRCHFVNTNIRSFSHDNYNRVLWSV